MMNSSFSIDDLARRVRSKELEIEEISHLLPCYLHINSLEDSSLLEVDNKLQQLIDMSKDDMNEQGFELVQQIVHEDDLINAVDVTMNYLNNPDDFSHISFLQRVTFPTTNVRQIYYTRGKLLDDKRILNISTPIEDLELFYQNAFGLLNNAAFIKSNVHRYNLLTNREIQVCKLLCDGNSITEIADCLNVSNHTVKNHKIRIYEKLGVNNYFDFYFFAKRFNLHI